MIQRLLTAAALLASVLTLSATPAYASRDAVQLGSNINVPVGATVHDAVCFFCSVNVQGAVDGDIVVFFGNVHITGSANHDVVNFFGNVNAEDNSSIGHDLVNFFGVVRLGENVAVGQDMVAMFGGVHAADSVIVGGDRVSYPFFIFFLPIAIFGIVLIVVVHELRVHRRRQFYARYPSPPMPPGL